jgi:deazaflavin-dependent oxidoreductase (nitroreductase family)
MGAMATAALIKQAKDKLGCAVRTARNPAGRKKVLARIKDAAAKGVNRAHPALLRATKGRLGARVFRAPVLLLTTTGRRSGKERTVPLLYLAQGDRIALVGSYGGDDRDPLWVHNIRADPAVTVEIDGRRRPMRASIASAEEKAALWPKVLELYRPYDNYQRRTERDIPVVWLDPV